MKHVIVIGGGAAGCMAAVAAAQKGAAVTLLERNPKLGRKLYITGKGRCNVTNDCAAPEVLQNVPRNSRFLTSAVTRFPPEAVKAFFEGLGVPLKTERGNRVFPCSDKAADNIDAYLGFDHKIHTDVEIPPAHLTNSPPCGRVNLKNRHLDCYCGDFTLLKEGMTLEEAQQEAGRCLRCDHFGYGIFKGGRNTEW